MNWKELIQPHLWDLQPYQSARHEYQGAAEIFLDANENNFAGTWARYPDPRQQRLKKRIAEIKQLSPDQIFLGNGSDEVIDLLIRLFARPGRDSVFTLPPTYGMYRVAAQIQGVGIKEIPLNTSLQPDLGRILAQAKPEDKLLFLCSPNNPTGNLMDEETVHILLEAFKGVVVIDEAYIDFTDQPSWSQKLDRYPNLVVLQTLSKAWGLAGLRVGMAFADPGLVEWLSRIKPPYNISTVTQELALEQLSRVETKNEWVKQILAERSWMRKKLLAITEVSEIYPSEANFLLVRLKRADELYRFLIQQGIIVRNRSKLALCQDGLRITVGLPEENRLLLAAILSFYQQKNVPIR